MYYKSIPRKSAKSRAIPHDSTKKKLVNSDKSLLNFEMFLQDHKKCHPPKKTEKSTKSNKQHPKL